MTAVSSIKNLGPAFEASCTAAGILSAEELRELGADAAYSKIMECGSKPHFIGYYVLVMALQGRPWNDCQGQEKADLRKRFDKLKAQRTVDPTSEIETMLNAIGVLPKSG